MKSCRLTMNGAEEFRGLQNRIAAFICAETADNFDRLALDLFAFQVNANLPYQKFCERQPLPRSWDEIPAVPLDAFRFTELISFPQELIQTTFRTSGTTGEGFGQHHFGSLELYELAALSGWRHAGLPEGRIQALLASPKDAPHSSLSCMAGWLEAQFYLRAGQFDWSELLNSLEDSSEPPVLLGTALAFLDFFEWLGARRIELPEGSRAIETGGYKGTRRSLPKSELYELFHQRLGLAADSIVNEYGMTELSSQFYTQGLGRPHRGGHWVRARVLDPQTEREVSEGEMGVLRIFDLANLGSALALQTRDLAIRRGEAFELIGRDPAALPRGCSRTVA